MLPREIEENEDVMSGGINAKKQEALAKTLTMGISGLGGSVNCLMVPRFNNSS